VTSVAFSGLSELEPKSYSYVAKCSRAHVEPVRHDRFITGAAFGVDTLAAYLAYAWRRDARHTIVVPGGAHNVEIVQFAIAMDLEVIYMPGNSTYMDRNSKMVNLADRLVAYPATEHEVVRGGESAGTWSTIRRARKKGIEMFIYPLNRAKPWKENVR
jgi:hypothetical protein